MARGQALKGARASGTDTSACAPRSSALPNRPPSPSRCPRLPPISLPLLPGCLCNSPPRSCPGAATQGKSCSAPKAAGWSATRCAAGLAPARCEGPQLAPCRWQRPTPPSPRAARAQGEQQRLVRGPGGQTLTALPRSKRHRPAISKPSCKAWLCYSIFMMNKKHVPLPFSVVPATGAQGFPNLPPHAGTSPAGTAKGR